MFCGRDFSAAALVLTAAVLTACAAAPTRTDPAPNPRQRELANGYSLLHDLLAKQADVDKVLWIKSADPATETLLQDIAVASKAGRDWIAQTVQATPGLSLNQAHLPPLEMATREAIERTSRAAILMGGDFARRMLLSQISAIEYGTHLAQVLAERENDAARQTWLREWAKRYADLYDRAVQGMQVADDPKKAQK
jgi:hypothetical protein